MSKLLNIDELAAHVQCSVRHIHDEIKRGNLKAAKMGKRLVFKDAEIEKWINRKTVRAVS